MGRYNAVSDIDYYLGSEPQPIVMTCRDCKGRVYVSKDEPYPGPFVQCDRCALKERPINAVPTIGAA
jgi:hypothetical protein